MPTDNQIQASRINGAKSRGPITPKGKQASSRNAITHGMLADTIVLEGESRDRFLKLLLALKDELQPQTGVETSLVENMAAARWRQMRIWGMEKVGMDREMRRSAEASGEPLDPATRSVIAFRTLSDESRYLDLINRYESRYERQYLRAHRRFLEVRDRRTPPVPNPVPETSPEPGPGPVPAPVSETPICDKVLFAKRTQEAPPSLRRARKNHRRFARTSRSRLRYSETLTTGTLAQRSQINDARKTAR